MSAKRAIRAEHHDGTTWHELPPTWELRYTTAPAPTLYHQAGDYTTPVQGHWRVYLRGRLIASTRPTRAKEPRCPRPTTDADTSSSSEPAPTPATAGS